MDETPRNALEEDAYCLIEAAALLDQARGLDDDGEALAAALNNNLNLWVAIHSVISQPDNRFSDALRENLSRLSRYVVSTSHGQGTEMGEAMLDTLININLQISEGLLEGAERAETED